jgi:putative lipoic acid-binding regulatory protein
LKEIELPEFEFPARYPLKIMGRAVPEFTSVVVEIVREHAPDFDYENVSMRLSSKGTFASLHLEIVATDRDMLNALHAQLMACGLVKMVL